jgi:PAS domain S-box-containing protein
MKDQSLRALIVEDSEDDALLLIRNLKKGGYTLVYERVETAAAMKKALKEKEWDLILCDYKMPNFNAPSALALLKEANIDLPVIIVSGTIGEETAVECMRLGARDYIMKSRMSRLCPAIARELKEAKARKKQMRTEEKLRHEEQRFRALSEQSLDMIILVNRELAVTYVNPAVERFLGLKEKRIIGHKILENLHPDYFELVTGIFNTFFNDPSTSIQRAEVRLSRIDGSWHDFEAMGTNLVQNGVVAGVIVNLHDITERKKAEERLKQSEGKYRLIADHTKDQVWLMDFDLNVNYISPSVEKLLGYTLDDFKDLPLDKILTPASFKEAMDFFSEEMSPALAATPDYVLTRTLELEFICKNGPTIWVECMFSLIRDEQGKPISLLGEARNITERKQMEYELRASESNFHHSLDDSPLGVRISTTDAETIYANKAILDIYGYDSIEELKKTDLKERYTPESYAQWLERKAKRSLGEFGPSEYEISIVRKDGEIRHLNVMRKEIFWNGEKQSQVIYQDITKRKQAEEKLSHTLENLRESIKTTIQVLGMASEAKDPYTAGHHRRVSHLARAIAKERGLSSDIIEGIRMAGSIHDIGKLSVPAEILTKPARLTDLEFSMIKEHSLSGYEMLKNVESPWPLAEIIYQHHERMNGTGYPRNLKEDEISMAARVMAVADVVEAMSSHRPYRASLGVEAALEEIEKNKGTLYDAEIVDACLRLFREKGYKLV